MSDYTDKRSSKRAPLTLTGADMGGTVKPQVMAPRRIAPGVRTFSQFFDPDKQRREVTRGEFLNLVSMLEYQRSESRWWRRAWRFLMGDAQVRSFLPHLVDAHARTLDEAKARLLAEQEKQQEAPHA